MAKIFLSPSNQNTNAYAWGDTNEMAQCNLIAQACETALIRNGFEVKRPPAGQGLTKTVEQSNAWGADLHIPIHTNASGGNVTGGTLVLLYSISGENEKAGRAILDAVAPLTPGGDYALRRNAGFYEIRSAKAITVYVECEFHDTVKGAKFIVENTAPLGEAIAKGVCSYYGVSFTESGSTPGQKPEEEERPVSSLNVGAWQRAAIADGYSFPKFGADGIWGDESLGVAKKALVRKTSPYTNKNLTKLVQSFLGVTADGLCGDKTTAAIKAWQGANGLTADGVIGVNSWKKLLSV